MHRVLIVVLLGIGIVPGVLSFVPTPFDQAVLWAPIVVRAKCFAIDAGVHRLSVVEVMKGELPEHGLCAGDLGAVVEVYPPDGLEVEFVTASGRTKALVTLNASDVRPIADSDLVAVRSLERSA